MWTPEPNQIITAEMKAADEHASLVAGVKAEAARRILEIMPEYQQRNALALFAETAQLHGPDPANWPSEMQAVNADVMAKWEAIKAIRDRSNQIEAMDPIPADFRDDMYWAAAD